MIRSSLILFAGFTLLKCAERPAQGVQNVSEEIKRQFSDAVKADDLETINFLLENGIPVDIWLPGDGSSALGVAAHLDKLDVASLLIASGANVNKANSDWATPLMVAARYTSPQMLNLLIDNGANVNYSAPVSSPEYGSTPLSSAFKAHDNYVKAQLLIKKGAIIGDNYVSQPITLNSISDHEQMVQRMENVPGIENEPNISLLNSLFGRSLGIIDRKTLDEQLTKIRKILPDNYAASYESPLLNGSSDIFYLFYVDKDEQSVRYTTWRDRIKLLIKADNNLTNLNAINRGQTGDNEWLYTVAGLGHWILSTIKRAPAIFQPIIKIVKGPGLPLVRAVENDDPEEVRAILKSVYETASSNPNLSEKENKANGEKAVELNINLRDAEGKTALLHAVLNNNITLVEILLNQNADPTIPDNTGKGPLDYLIELETECNKIKTIQALFSAHRNRVVKKNEKSQTTFQSSKIVPNDQGLLLVQAAKNDDVAAVRKILKSVYETASNNSKLSMQENKANGEKAVESTINLQDEDGKTPLHYAVLNYDYLLTGILLNKKADPTLPDNTGKSPLDYVLEFETECTKIKTIQALLFAHQNRAFRNQAEAVKEQNKVNNVSSN